MRDLAARRFEGCGRDAINRELRRLGDEFAGCYRHGDLRMSKRDAGRKRRDESVIQGVAALMSAAHGRCIRMSSASAHRLRLGMRRVHRAHNGAIAFRWVAEHTACEQGQRSSQHGNGNENGFKTAHCLACYHRSNDTMTFESAVVIPGKCICAISFLQRCFATWFAIGSKNYAAIQADLPREV